jgi:hypothetical protein
MESTNIINVGTGVTINGSTGIISATALFLGNTYWCSVTFITAGSGISVNRRINIRMIGIGTHKSKILIWKLVQ